MVAGKARSEPAGAQPGETITAGGETNKEGWKVGAQLTKEEGSYVAAVVERNRDVFAFSLEELGEFKLFEVELKLKFEQPIFRDGAGTAFGNGSWWTNAAGSWRRRGSLGNVIAISLQIR
jgi:hypothetical protein